MQSYNTTDQEVKNEKFDPQDFSFRLKEYVNTKIRLTTLLITEKLASALPTIFSYVVMIFLFLIAFIFISIAGAVYLGQILNSLPIGFLIVAGFYLLIGIIFKYTFKNMIEKPFSDIIISSILKEKKEDEAGNY